MELTIKGNEITDRIAFYAQMASQLEAPDYLGYNLDALHDLLTECPDRINVTISAPSQVKDAIGHGYYHSLLDMLEDCCSQILISPE